MSGCPLGGVLRARILHFRPTGKAVAAAGNYFRRLARAELEAADAGKAEFERYVGLEWNRRVTAAGGAGGANPIFIGALGPVKPRLADVV